MTVSGENQENDHDCYFFIFKQRKKGGSEKRNRNMEKSDRKIR